jgi:hypothetical protein
MCSREFGSDWMDVGGITCYRAISTSECALKAVPPTLAVFLSPMKKK